MIGIVGGFVAGLFHRFFLSPFIGQQTRAAQSIGTPAAGVIVAFVPFRLSFWWMLQRIIPDKRQREEVALAADYAYWSVFLFYGLAVVVTILAKVGGVREDKL